jgi:hypothetical protein
MLKLITLALLISTPAFADFSIMFNDCKNLIADGKTLEITPGSPYSMSCIETQNTYRCNVQYNNNTSKESVFVRNVDPSGKMYFGSTDGAVSYQVNPKEKTAMNIVRISTKTMLGSRACNGLYMSVAEAKKYVQKLKEAEKNTPAPAPTTTPAPTATPTPSAPSKPQ